MSAWTKLKSSRRRGAAMFSQRPGLEVVHADHAVAALEQVVAEVRAEEPGAARHQ